MKKNILFILSIIGALAIGIFLGNKLNTLVSKPVRIETIHTTYTQYGRYYTSGTLITNDGNEWGYDTSEVSNTPIYDNMPIWVAFDDNGTPDNITDDIILGMVYDRTTACMDALEEELSDSFTLTRNENTITIQTHK